MALLRGNPLSLHSRGCFIWQSWVNTLGNTTKSIPVEFVLVWRWKTTEVIIQPDRRVHMALGTSLILKGVSNVSHADILSLQPAQAFQISLEMCCDAVKHKSLSTWKHPGSAPLSVFLMGCNCNNLTCILDECYVYCYVSFDLLQIEAFGGYLIEL